MGTKVNNKKKQKGKRIFVNILEKNLSVEERHTNLTLKLCMGRACTISSYQWALQANFMVIFIKNDVSKSMVKKSQLAGYEITLTTDV